MPTPDFSKIWASASPLPTFTFTDAEYTEGWDFVGSAPPTKNQFDAWFRYVDERLKWLFDEMQATASKLYPVGSVYISFNTTDPSTLFGGTWVRLKDTFLLASGDTYAANTTGGSSTKTIGVNNMPAHNHTVNASGNHNHTATTSTAGNHSHTRGTMNITGNVTSSVEESGSSASGAFTLDKTPYAGAGAGHTSWGFTFNASKSWTGSTSTAGNHTHTLTTTTTGSHTHTATTSTAGNHSHTRGSMNITGNFGGTDVQGGYYGNGAFAINSWGNYKDAGGTYQSGYGKNMNFDASRTWTGETSANGSHTHTIGNTGSGLPLNIMPPYQTVYMWRRTA